MELRKEYRVINEVIPLLNKDQIISPDKLLLLCNNDEALRDKIKLVFLTHGMAREDKYIKNQLRNNEKTEDASVYFKELYAQKEKEKEKEKRSAIKADLEINEIKRNKWLSVIAIAVSIIALLVSILK